MIAYLFGGLFAQDLFKHHLPKLNVRIMLMLWAFRDDWDFYLHPRLFCHEAVVFLRKRIEISDL